MLTHQSQLIAGLLESANSSILAANRFFKEVVGKNQITAGAHRGACRGVRKGVHRGVCRGAHRGAHRGMHRGACRGVHRGACRGGGERIRILC